MYRTPTHIGIIPDGNRRWATRNGLNKEDGYNYGLPAGLELLRAAKRRGIKELTYYGFTVDNCKRPKAQVSAFRDACCKAVELMESENAAVCVVGNTESPCFPPELIPYTKRMPDAQNKLRVNLLVNYGWEWDLKNGWLSRSVPRIDLVIRWGGMCRLSGFLPVQTVYSDFYIVKDLWPDYKEQHLTDALDWYSRQDVTLGG
ncbi:MAG: undecaprenyl diphosphate synthase family protein [Clostridiales bacterium]|nr:undecaprenyl diphosphate synthase family protein [Clostridiales bacterium]